MSSSGGRAAAGGNWYQERVAAWLATRLLDGPHAAPLWDLPHGTTIEWVWCQPPIEVDDVFLGTSQCGFIFGQAKRGSVRLSTTEGSPLAKTIAQFVRQFLRSWEGRIVGRERGIDPSRDRFVLFLESSAGRPVTRDVATVLARLRTIGEGTEPDREEICRSQNDSDAFSALIALVQATWRAERAEDPTTQDVCRVLRLMYIQRADVDDDEANGREARDTLAKLVHRSGGGGNAWPVLLDAVAHLDVNGCRADEGTLRRALERGGVPLGPAPRVERDVQRLKEHTTATLTSLLADAGLPSDSGPPIRIQRSSMGVIADACQEASLVVVGEAGIGKTVALAVLANELRESGRDVVMLDATDLTSSPLAQLRHGLDLESGLPEILRSWSGPGAAVLFIDALDAARDQSTLDQLLKLLKAVRDLPRWRVVASIREYDLVRGPRIQDLFRGAPPSSDHADQRFKDVRHVHVARLTEGELHELAGALPSAGRVLAAEPSRDLLRVPFNLRLAADLLADHVSVDDVAAADSSLALLDLYWSHRVTALEHEPVLENVVGHMLTAQRLQAPLAEIRRGNPGSMGLLEDLCRASVLTIRSGVHGDSVHFAHHILFDYAVARLVLRRRPEDVARFVSAAPGRAITVLPSLRMHFLWVWNHAPDRQPFWDLLFALGEDPHSAAVRRLGYAVLVDSARSAVDLEPLLRRVETAGAPKGDGAALAPLHELVRALAAIEDCPIEMNWASLANRLTAWTGTDRSPLVDAAQLMVHILANRIERLPDAHRADLGAAARRLLAHALGLPDWQQVFVMQSLRAVCRTFAADPGASAEMIRRCLEPERLRSHDHVLIPVVAQHIGEIVAADPAFASEFYGRAFGHPLPSGDEVTVLSPSQIVGMSSNRQQDYRSGLYALKAEYPRFLNEAPREATAALVRIAGHYGSRNSSVRSVEPPAGTFPLCDRTARLIPDGSRYWDTGPTYHEEEREMLETFEQSLVTHAGQNDEQWLATVLDALIEENELARIWRRVLKAAAAEPKRLGLVFASSLCSPDLLLSRDTRYEAAVLVEAIYPLLGVAAREKIERSIVSLPNDCIVGDRTYAEKCRDRLLAHLKKHELLTQQARSCHEALSPEVLLGPDGPEFTPGEWSSRTLTAEDVFEGRGIDVKSKAYLALVPLRDAVQKYCEDQGAATLRMDVTTTTTHIQALKSYLGTVEAATMDPAVLDQARGILAAASAKLLAGGGLGEEQNTFILAMLLEASSSNQPEFSEAAEAEFAKWPAFGWPAARVHAAEGLTLAARDGDAPILQAVVRLAADPVAAVRLAVANRLHVVLKSAAAEATRIFEQRLVEEESPPVAVALVHGPLAWLAACDADQAAEKTLRLLERFAVGTPVDSAHGDVRRACVQLLADLHLRTDSPRAEEYALRLARTPLSDPDGARMFAAKACQHLRADNAEPVMRARAWTFVGLLTESATKAWHDAVEAHGPAFGTWPSEAQALGRDAVKVGAEVATWLYFGSGATDDAGSDGMEATAMNEFLQKAGPLVEALGKLPSADASYNLAQMLEWLIGADPARAFDLLAGLVINAAEAGLHYEMLAADLVVRVIEQYLAQHRDLLTDDDRLRTLLELLNIFADAGWPKAWRLTYRLEEIYR